MILRQYLDDTPAVAASYLFGCGGKAIGALVDPTEAIERYLRDARSLGLRIRYVLDTHVHADHVSGGPRLAEAAGAEYVIFAGADARLPFRGVDDGEVLELGNVCGRGLSGKVSSTIGFERWFNRAFSLVDEEEFVALMLREIPPAPEGAREIRERNLGLVAAVEA